MFDATSQRGPNQRKSTSDVFGSRDLAVRTQLTDGSVWSMEVEFWDENFVRSYYASQYAMSLRKGKGVTLYGTTFPCHATKSNGV